MPKFNAENVFIFICLVLVVVIVGAALFGYFTDRWGPYQ